MNCGCCESVGREAGREMGEREGGGMVRRRLRLLLLVQGRKTWEFIEFTSRVFFISPPKSHRSNGAMTALKARNFSFGDIPVGSIGVSCLSSPKRKDNVISKFADGSSDWERLERGGTLKVFSPIKFFSCFLSQRLSE